MVQGALQIPEAGGDFIGQVVRPQLVADADRHFTDVMVDIETTGTDSSHSHMIQLAAVRFNIETKQIDTDEMFDRCLLPVGSSRFWDESTRIWWSQQKAGVLDDILSRGEDPRTVLLAFTDFLARTRSPRPVRLWAKPISFEWPFLQSYMREYTVLMPIPYWNCMDLNSYINGRGHLDRKAFWAEIPFEGDQHNALFDVIHQIKGAFAA
jgi:DNA polymerase III alpha subunit (gram-positive type)